MVEFGLDPEWFGVITEMAVTFGMITPPITPLVAINVFVINSIARDILLGTIHRGIGPFVVVDIVRLVVLCMFPALSLWLPGLLL